jgi:hypothetical protein
VPQHKAQAGIIAHNHLIAIGLRDFSRKSAAGWREEILPTY